MAAPVKYTCSDINDAQSVLRRADGDLDYIAQCLGCEEVDADDALRYVRSVRSDINDVCRNHLETLRDANDKLRDWGTENEEALEALREEHADLVRDHEALTQKAEDEESRADSLQEELDSLQKVLWAHALPPELAAALRQAAFGPPGEQLELLPSPPPEANSAVVLDPAA